jgi:hypothetical protein
MSVIRNFSRVGRSDMVLFAPSEDDIELYGHWNTISMMLVEQVSHLDEAAGRHIQRN